MDLSNSQSLLCCKHLAVLQTACYATNQTPCCATNSLLCYKHLAMLQSKHLAVLQTACYATNTSLCYKHLAMLQTLRYATNTNKGRGRSNTDKETEGDSLLLTPSLPQAVKLRVERCTDAPANSIFSSPITQLLLMLCVVMKVLPHASAKKKTKRLKGVKFHTFSGRFQVTSW